MKKKILIVSIITIFLILMMPFVPAIEPVIVNERKNIQYSCSPEKTRLNQNHCEKNINSGISGDNITKYYALIAGCSKYEEWQHNLPIYKPFPESTMKYVYNSLLNATNWKKENIVLLLNEEATKERILNTFSEMSKKIDSDDVFLFSWMGHGTSIPDDDNDENDGFDEAICPYDTKKVSGRLENITTDDELDMIFSKINASGQFIMFESCMSGDMVEDKNQTNMGLLDVNKEGRVVVMSTPPGKLGFAFPVIGWPMSLLYGQALSDPKCDINHDGWLSAEEVFYQVDEAYPILEQKMISDLVNITIPFAVLTNFIFANQLLKKIGIKPIMRIILSGIWSFFAYKTYQNEELMNEMVKKKLLSKGAENNPNMVDDYLGELNIIKLN